jgi:integrase
MPNQVSDAGCSRKERKRITKRLVDAMPPGQTIWDKDLTGFGVRRQTRDPSFVLKCSFRGRQRFYTIGRYGVLTVDEARNEARRLLGMVASGVDPSEQRDRAQALDAPLTVEQLCRRYLSEGPSFKPDKKDSSWLTDRSNIEGHIVPLVGNLPAAKLREFEVVTLVSQVTRGDSRRDVRTGPRGRSIVRGGKGTATRVLAVLRAVFNFGIRLALVQTNPVKHLKAPRGNAPGRFLSDKEWARLGAAMRDVQAIMANGAFIDSIKLIALTGCRKSEICNLTWAEVDIDRGFLRLRQSKVGPRAVPLGDDAVLLLAGMKEVANASWVFPSRRGGGPIVGLQKV